MPQESKAVLRINGQGEVPVSQVSGFLAALEEAYSGASLFLHTIDQLDRWGPLPFAYWHMPFFRPASGRIPLARIISEELDFSLQLPSRQRLMLQAVRLESPGWWELAGKLNPLEVIRQYLNDRHERQKDISYRNKAERDRLHYENEILRNRVIAERIELARKLGASDEDLAPLWNSLLIRPLRRLDTFQDRGVISDAQSQEVRPPSRER